MSASWTALTSVSVNLATEKADVIYDLPGSPSFRHQEGHQDAGYTPRDIDAVGRPWTMDAERKEREIRVMWTKFIVAAAAAVPLLYLAMGHMIPRA